MRIEKISFAGHGGDMLPAAIWEPDGQPKMLLQVAHGMTEHIGRYENLAETLTANGVVVAGFDLRGHGMNPGNPQIASFGNGGWEKSLEDMHLFYDELKRRYPALPHFMLGFSLGSFLLREYLGRYDDDIAGAVILGTGNQPGLLLKIMCAIVMGQIKKSGFDGTTPLVQKLSFETYNQKFKPNRTSSDWLCADEKELDMYIGDKLCREHISSGLFWELLSAMQRTGNAGACGAWRKDMPVLVMSGQDDPVGGSGKGVKQFEADMRRAGLTNISMKLFPGARHDLLHEEASGNAQAARKMLTDWLVANT
ncbi:MAG: alpha/beta fold hydrolase [Clostridia bacterium]|nr:alpha/beta fold hydrolase [Clostridia bacterium]